MDIKFGLEYTIQFHIIIIQINGYLSRVGVSGVKYIRSNIILR